ncbi:phosphotransferase [Nocardia sp. CA-120079]|uniref:phosphotransferase n=1 Tax=Nocardia sp. CA-120079 TaxID=3239974 RepID=UPI003D970631
MADTSWLEHVADPKSKGRAYFSMLDVPTVQGLIDTRIDCLPSELTSAQRCIDLFWGFVAASELGDQTLLHGDLHVGNVYFDGPHAAMCDWQVVGRGSPAFDLAYLIGSAMTTDGRRESEYGLFAWLTNREAFQPSDIIAEVPRRFAIAVVDLDTAVAVGLPHRPSRYRHVRHMSRNRRVEEECWPKHRSPSSNGWTPGSCVPGRASGPPSSNSWPNVTGPRSRLSI